MPNKILVLGAKFDVKLPDLHFEKIYTANGAAKLIKNYRAKYENIYHISVLGEQEFRKNIIVQNSVIESQPNRVFVRNGKIDTNKFKFQNLEKYDSSSSIRDIKFQLEFLNLNIIEFILAELKYSNKKKINYFFKCLRKFNFQGFSSGLFASLLALKENPNSEIVISGIGLNEGGGHFYTSPDHKGYFSSNDIKKNKETSYRNTNRKKVEKYLFDCLKSQFKERINSCDRSFCELSNVQYFDCQNTINFTRN